MILSCTNKENNSISHSCEELLNEKEIVNITIWHSYGASQKEKFDLLVDSFNNTVGSQYGVFVKGLKKTGNINEIPKFINDALDHELGADEVPDIFFAYPDTAFEFNKKGLLVDLNQYFKPNEKKEYIDDFLFSSSFGNKNEIKLFPVAKATEILILNKTAWDEFSKVANCSYKDMETWEGLVEVAEKYYKWSDSLSPKKNDGKPFFGRDSIGNYILVGAHELGDTVFDFYGDGTVGFQLSKPTFKILWDNYYIPFIKGYFTAKGRFRSDDLKTGDIIACVSSSTSAIYLPSEIIDNSGTPKKIELEILPAPHFKNAKTKTIVQQGADMAVLKSNLKRELASVLFLKWFTDEKQNIDFSINSGYLPVKKTALKKEKIDKFIKNVDKPINKYVRDSIYIGIEMLQKNRLYFQPGFKNANELRNRLTTLLEKKAKEDRLKLEQALDTGIEYEKALEPFLKDENFQNWCLEILLLMDFDKNKD